MTKQIFISYSHADRPWLERLLVVLAPLAREPEIDVWNDTQIAPGEKWQQSIDAQLDRSNVAVLLVTAGFLASEFITAVELPRVLTRAEQGLLTLVWIPVSASMWEATDLKQFQAALDPHRPMDQMTNAEAQQALVTVAHRIAGARTLTDLSQAMHIIDETYNDIAEQAGEQRPIAPPRVVARHTGTEVVFEERGRVEPIEKITYDDLAQLPSEEHRLIRSLEESMNNEFERWTMLLPRRATLTGSELEVYEQSGRIMCQDLSHILDFIEYTLGKNLHDHYNGIRYACDKLIH